jgi:hypothetical protein
MVAGIAAAATATTVLQPRAAKVATKTLAVTAMAGKQTTINNQLKAAAAIATEMATMTATTMTKSTKAPGAARWWRRRRAAHRQRDGNKNGRGSCRHRCAATARCRSGD